MILKAFTYLYILKFVWSKGVEEPNFALYQLIKNNGFHREFEWFLESTFTDEQVNSFLNCKYVLRIVIPTGIFVNPDEIADFNRKKLINAFLEGFVDVEAPEYDAREHIVYVFLNGSKIRNTTITLPFHLRYHRAAFGGGVAEVNINKPSLLVYCPAGIVKFFENYPKVGGVCDSKGQSHCTWQNITYKAFFEDTQILVPVGNLDHFPLVAIVSLILGCLGCIYILSILSSGKRD